MIKIISLCVDSVVLLSLSTCCSNPDSGFACVITPQFNDKLFVL